MHTTSWTASGWNMPPLGPGSNTASYSNHQAVFNGNANGNPYSYVGQHQSRLQYYLTHAEPNLMPTGHVENGSHLNHQLPQVQTAPSTATQGTAPFLASRSQSLRNGIGPCTALSSNGVQWGSASSWNSTQRLPFAPNLPESSVTVQNNSLHSITQRPTFQPHTQSPLKRVFERRLASANSFPPYRMKPTGEQCYAVWKAPVTQCLENGGIVAVDNQRISNTNSNPTIGSPLRQNANFIYPVPERLTGPIVVQTALNNPRVPNCGVEAVPVHEAVTWGRGQGISAAASSVVQNAIANCQPSNTEVSVASSEKKAQGIDSSGSTVSLEFLSNLTDRIAFMLVNKTGQTGNGSENASVVPKGARATNHSGMATANLPSPNLNPNSSFANGNSDSTYYSNSNHLQLSSGPNDTRRPQQNFPRNASGGIIPHGAALIQQHSHSLPAVFQLPQPTAQPQRNEGSNSQGLVVWFGNLANGHQNHQLPHQRLSQIGTATSSALGQLNDGTGERQLCMKPTANPPLTSASTSTCHNNQHPNKGMQSCGQQHHGKNNDTPAYVSEMKVRQRNRPSAENVVLKCNPPQSYTLTLMQIPGNTTKVVSGEPSGEHNSPNSAEKHGSKWVNTETSSPACVQQLENTNNQQNMSTISGVQKAIAVVPPISQQSNTDQASAIVSEDEARKIDHVQSFADKSVGDRDHLALSLVCLSQKAKNDDPAISALDKPLCDVATDVPTTEDLDKARLSNQQPAVSSAGNPTLIVGSSTESMCSDVKSDTQPNANNKDGVQELPSKEDPFDLSTVPVIVWTADKLNELIASLEDVSTPPELNVEEGSIPRIVSIYWGGSEKNLYNALNRQETIFDTWRIRTNEENPVVLSEITSVCNAKVAEKCLILGHEDLIDEPVCESSSLNVCDKVDNVDKYDGKTLSHGMKMSERGNERMERNKMEKSNMEGPPPYPVDVKLQESQSHSQTETVVPSVEVCDPLSLIQIKVLSPSEAKNLQLFCSQSSEDDMAENLQSKLPENGSDVSQGAVDSYCCLSRWMEMAFGYEENSVCKCRADSCQEEPAVPETVDKEGKKEGEERFSEECDFLPAEPNCTLVYPTKLTAAKLHVADECDVSTECTAASNADKDPLCAVSDTLTITMESPAESSGGEKVSEKCSPEHAREGSILELITQGTVAGDTDLNVECSSLEEVLIAAAETSEQLWSRQVAEQTLFGSDHSKTDAQDVALEKVRSIADSTLMDTQQVVLQGQLKETVSPSLRPSLHAKLSFRKKQKKQKSRRNEIRRDDKPIKSTAKPPLQNRSLQSHKVKNKSSDIKANMDRSRNSQQLMTLNVKNKNGSSNVTEPSDDGRSKSKSESEAKALLPRKERAEKVSVVSESFTASLALYGSSPRQESVFSSTQADMKSRTDPMTGPPRTISLKISSQRRPFLEKDHLQKSTAAKQRVYLSWERSLVPQERELKSKGLNSPKNSESKSSHKRGNRKTQKPRVKLSKTVETGKVNSTAGPGSSQERVFLMKPKKLDKRTVSPFSRLVQMDSGTCKSGVVQNQHQSLQKDEHPLHLDQKKRKGPERGRPVLASKRPCTISRDLTGKSKYEIGNPALMPLPVTENVLNYELLPASFNFKGTRGTKMKNPSKELTDSSTPEKSDHNLERPKIANWKRKGQWGHGPSTEDPTAPSDRVGQSQNAYEEYKKRFLAKAVK